jgi:hypothetical protein
MPLITQRSEPRVSVRISARIKLFHPERESEADIIDFSHHGMGLEICDKIPSDAAVVVIYKGVWIFADAMYCVPAAGCGYRIGLRIRDALALEPGVMSSQAASRELTAAFS